MITPNGMDRQPDEERLADASRYLKGRMKKKIKGSISFKVKAILAAILVLLLIIFILFFSFEVPDLQRKHATEMADTIYKELEVESLLDFIEIKGDDSSGHYYGFVEGADEKLEKLVKKLKRINENIDIDLLKKMIKAEVVNQFPLLIGGSTSKGGKGGIASSYTGNTIAEKTWNFLIGQGYSEIAVAGLMGNIHQESFGFDPAIVKNGGSGEGIGLVQWSKGRRKQLENYAASQGKHWSDVDLQLDFLLMELTPGGSQYADFQFIPSSAYEQWKNASSIEEATRIFSRTFERPNLEKERLDNRIHWAKVYYERYKGTFDPKEDIIGGKTLESLDGVLFIGDSITVGIENTAPPQGSIIKAHIGWGPYNWNNSLTQLPQDSEQIKGICIMLGTNLTLYDKSYTTEENISRQVSAMKKFLQNVKGKYPNKLIFVQKAVEPPNDSSTPDGNTIVKRYNEKIKEYCDDEENLNYIDTLSGVQYNPDGIHPTTQGTKTLVKNIENAICNGEYSTSGSGGFTPIGEFQGTIRIRRVTPNKNIGEVKNTGAGASISMDAEGLGSKQPIPENIKQQMEGVSMQHLSGVTYDELSYLTIPHYDFEGNVQQGHMVVNAKLADEVLLIFQELYKIKYPIERMELIDNFSGSGNLTGAQLDYASIEANNTSSFNDRVTVDPSGAGTEPSLHAKGQAIDINPQINPYINPDRTSAHPNAQKYNTNRDTKEGWTEVEKAACITKDAEIYKIFTEYGWKWLGNDQNTGDTQHFYKDDLSNVKTINTETQYTDNNASGSGLNTEIQNYIKSNAASGEWSVYAKNLVTNSVKVNINNRKLESASLIKLFIMATAYEEIEKGTLNKAEVINDIKIMINQSDNAATNRMIDKLEFNKINNYIKTHNYNSTQISRKMLEKEPRGDNYTSVVDVGNLLESIYRGTCVSKDASKEMLEILKTQTRKGKIPAGVPSGVTTANKTGELDDVENDAAIVYKDGAHYLIVVMSNNLNDTAKAQNNIREISSKIYQGIDTSSSSQGGTNANAKHKVAIVAGHGLSKNAGTPEQVNNKTKYYTKGGSGKTQSGETWQEYRITKKVADYVEKYLSPYSSQISVVQVGYSQPNWERMQLAKKQGVDSYVGIHFSSSEDANENGISTYYTNGDSKSQSFANIFSSKVSEAMGLANKGTKTDNPSSNVELQAIGNSSEWGFPSVLVNGGFMSNSSDMNVIGETDEAGLQKYAKGIAEGILEYYGIENMGLDGANLTSSITTTVDGINSKIYDLTYVSPEKFKELVEKNSRKALDVYTLDEKTKKLIIANWSYTTEKGIEIKECSPINFRSVLNKYTMPIEYMIAFLVHTNDAELVSKLADLALDSEYVISIQDNVNTVETTVDIQEKKYLEIKDATTGSWYISEEHFDDWHTVSKDIKVNETVSNEIELTYADSWFVKFFKTTSYSTMSFEQGGSNNLTGERGEFVGNYRTTSFCYTCNDDGNGNFGTNIGNHDNELIENLSVAIHTNDPNGLKTGDYLWIDGKIYRVDDSGTGKPGVWMDFYVKSQSNIRGKCCNGSEWAERYNVPVYKANNVKEITEENTNEDTEISDAEDKNKEIKGINTIANVAGKVTDTTNVTEEALSPRYEAENSGMQWHTERKKITTVRTITNKYDSGKEEIESSEQKVIDVLLSSKGLIEHRFNIKWMTSILEQDEKTVNMIDLTKYLYNKAKAQLSNVQSSNEKYSFDVYKNNDLYRIYGSTGILEEFIKALENNPLRLYMSNHVSVDEGEIFDYITKEDEPSYKMLTNEYDGRGFGFNIFHRLNETDWDTGGEYEPRIVEHYKDLSVDIKKYVNMDQTLETSTVDQVMRKEINKWKEKVEESLKDKGVELEEYQIDALTTIAYEYGWSAEYANKFVDTYKNYYLKDDKEKFQEKFELPLLEIKPFWVDTSSRSKTEAEEKQNLRNQLVWNLFDTGKYKTPEGEILDPDSFHGGNGEFLDVAYEIWLEVCKRFTSYGGSEIPPTGTQIDCSGYVSWVLYQYGVVTGDDDLVKEFKRWQHTTETLKEVPWDKFGFEEIPVAAGQDVTSILQPGDILDRSVGTGASGHTQIIVEVKNHVVYTYDCGSASHWLGKNGEPYISNFASADSRPGIIIRKK